MKNPLNDILKSAKQTEQQSQLISLTPLNSDLIDLSQTKKQKFIEIQGQIPANVKKPEIILLKKNLYIDVKQPKPDFVSCDCPDHRHSCKHSSYCCNRLSNEECDLHAHQDADGNYIDCGNQRIQRHQFVKTKVVYINQFKGFGLLAAQNIKIGDYVVEYMGEILSKRLMMKRIKEEKGELYIMKITGNSYVDARYKGNAARFANHSCDPNMEVRQFKVGGEIHNILVAIKDIQIGEELCFDYNMQATCSTANIKCYCGAKNCRGWLIHVDEKKVAQNKQLYEQLEQ